MTKCEKAWITVSGNEKVWDDDPTTCKELQETVCSPKQSWRTKKEPYRKCDKEPYQDCKEVPKKNCWQVTKQRCWNQDYQDCQQVPHKECHDEHKLIPYQSRKRKAFKICQGDSNPYEMSRKELEDYDYFDPRGADPDLDEDDLEEDAEYVDVDTLEDIFGKNSNDGNDDNHRDVEEVAADKPVKVKADSAIVFGS